MDMLENVGKNGLNNSSSAIAYLSAAFMRLFLDEN